MKYLLLLTLCLHANAADVTKEFPVRPQTHQEIQSDGSLLIKIPPEIVKQCQAEGGCALVTADWVKGAISKYSVYMCGKTAI